MADPGDNRPIIEVIHPSPDEAWKMPYVPAVSIVGACDLMFLSGCTPSKLYHHHPHIDEEHIHMRSLVTMKKTGGRLATWLLTQKASREGRKIIDQDIPIWEGKRYLSRPGLAEDDGPIMRFRHWARQFYTP